MDGHRLDQVRDLGGELIEGSLAWATCSAPGPCPPRSPRTVGRYVLDLVHRTARPADLEADRSSSLARGRSGGAGRSVKGNSRRSSISCIWRRPPASTVTRARCRRDSTSRPRCESRSSGSGCALAVQERGGRSDCLMRTSSQPSLSKSPKATPRPERRSRGRPEIEVASSNRPLPALW